jgi:hypothetical protein
MAAYFFNTSDYSILCFPGLTLTTKLQRETLVYSQHSFHNVTDTLTILMHCVTFQSAAADNIGILYA